MSRKRMRFSVLADFYYRIVFRITDYGMEVGLGVGV
jgi:hypothetical protein